MKTTAEFLEQARLRLGGISHYALADKLGVTRSAVSHYRHGRAYFDDEIALRVSRILELEPGYVLACVHSERAAKPEVKDAWEKVAGALAAVLLGIGLVEAPSPTPAGESAPSVYYVKSRPWRELQRRVVSLLFPTPTSTLQVLL